MSHSKIFRIFAALAFAWGLCGASQARDFASLEQARILQLAALLPGNPNGLGPSCDDRKRWTAPGISDRVKDLVVLAREQLTSPMPEWDNEAYLEFSRTGKRSRGESMLYRRKARLFPLVLAECVQWTGRFRPAIEDALRQIAGQPSWTLPAADTNLRNFSRKDFEVDLLAADTARDLAQALYMLGNAISESVRRDVLSAIELRVLAPVRFKLNRGSSDNAWLYRNNNWNAVCLDGVVSAALAILPDRRDRALFAVAGQTYIANYISGFTNDGYSPEGPAYWNYGFGHFVQLRHALHAATQGQIDLFDDQKVRNIALYGFRFEMLPGNVAAFGDAAASTRLDRFARAYANEAYELGGPEVLRRLSIETKPLGFSAPIANTVLLLFAAPPKPKALKPVTLRAGLEDYFGDAGVLVSRPAPGGRMAVTIKAGGNGGHSHNDIGSYAIALGTEQPAGDVGGTVYSAKTFSGSRYDIRAINSWGHPVPVVAGQLQLDATKVKPRVLEYRPGSSESFISIDMAPAYEAKPLRSLIRSLRHTRAKEERILIEDRFAFDSPQTFEVALTTRGRWKKRDDGSLELWQAAERMLATVESTADYDLVEEAVNEEGLAFTRIAIRLRAPQTAGSVAVRFTPLR